MNYIRAILGQPAEAGRTWSQLSKPGLAFQGPGQGAFPLPSLTPTAPRSQELLKPECGRCRSV